MVVAKVGKSSKKKPMHYSVGAVIKYGNKYLMISRKNPPLGYACVAGHVREDESVEAALARAVKEEAGLTITNCEKLFEEELDWNWCHLEFDCHHWNVFKCEVSGEPRRGLNDAKAIGWYSEEDIKKMQLEKVWKYWFEKMGVLQPK